MAICTKTACCDSEKIIESRSKQEVFNIMEATGFKRGCESWREYSRAKKLLFAGLWINSGIYELQIAWITEYLGFE